MKLIKKKWITPIGNEADSRKKEYVITDTGKQKAQEELKRMGEICELASTIIKGERNK